MTYERFQDIPQFPTVHYGVDVGWPYLEEHIKQASSKAGDFVMCPDYQRGHVWTEAQQIAYCEYVLMGGENSRVITTNCPGWMSTFKGPYELVDGLQRVTAALRFLRNEIPVFGRLRKDYKDKIHTFQVSFRWRVCALPTRAEVLRLYLLINAGGVVHSPEEITRVRNLLDLELSKKPT